MTSTAGPFIRRFWSSKQGHAREDLSQGLFDVLDPFLKVLKLDFKCFFDVCCFGVSSGDLHIYIHTYDYLEGSDGPGGGSGGPGGGYEVWGMVRMVRPNHPNHPVICPMPKHRASKSSP